MEEFAVSIKIIKTSYSFVATLYWDETATNINAAGASMLEALQALSNLMESQNLYTINDVEGYLFKNVRG